MEKYTKEEILKDIQEIKEKINDDETCHQIEDGINEAFIECVSLGLYSELELIELSKLILTVRDLDFSRWYA